MAARGLDPRATPDGSNEAGIMPVVATPRRGVPTPILIAAAVAAALTLFLVLDARRRVLESPGLDPPASQRIASAAPPPLLMPGAAPQPIIVQPAPVQVTAPVAPAPAPVIRPQIIYQPQPIPLPQPYVAEPALPPPRATTEPALVIDNTSPQAPAAAAPDAASPLSSNPSVIGARARAGMLANRSTTIPQGTIIQAVMETAFDSTRPGLARALVSRDVRGFDGRRVLVPRGSRLIGEYRSDTQPGQKRALVNWTRLVRPDGATIEIESPAGDRLGRGGIRADVDTHFFERFAAAILRSTVDIGLTLAASAGSAPVVLALPGAGQGSLPTAPSTQIPPTLRVRPGTSVSVLVARDLDFTAVDRRR